MYIKALLFLSLLCVVFFGLIWSGGVSSQIAGEVNALTDRAKFYSARISTVEKAAEGLVVSGEGRKVFSAIRVAYVFQGNGGWFLVERPQEEDLRVCRLHSDGTVEFISAKEAEKIISKRISNSSIVE